MVVEQALAEVLLVAQLAGVVFHLAGGRFISQEGDEEKKRLTLYQNNL